MNGQGEKPSMDNLCMLAWITAYEIDKQIPWPYLIFGYMFYATAVPFWQDSATSNNKACQIIKIRRGNGNGKWN